MGILSVYPGSYTPGAETALHAAIDTINASWDLAQNKTSELEAKISDITDETTGWLSTQAAPHIVAGAVPVPAVAEPAINIPANIDTSAILGEFETEYTKLRTLLVSDLCTLFGTYFPDDNATYTAAETWLRDGLASGRGIPAATAAQLLTEDKDRMTADAARAADALSQRFAAMRFPLISGQQASATLQLQQKLQEEIANSSRKIVVLSVEQLKWTVEKMLGLRELAMNSALDYIKALASAPDTASKVVGIGYDAQTKLITSTAQYLNARTEVQKLVNAAAEFNVNADLQADEKNQAADLQLIEDRLNALMTEIKAFAQLATSLFNNLHANAGTGYNVSVS